MIIMKFGGTSVEDAAAIKKYYGNRPEGNSATADRRRFRLCRGDKPAVENSGTRFKGKKDEALQNVAAIEGRHKNIAKELFDADTAKFLFKHIAVVCRRTGGAR